jgi:Fe-S-cluster containining protein
LNVEVGSDPKVYPLSSFEIPCSLFYIQYLRRMSTTVPVNMRAFRQKVRNRKTSLRRFLTKLQNNRLVDADKLSAEIEKHVWEKVNCLGCANCCKSMSPTYTGADMRRIASFLAMPVNAFKRKWLRKDRQGDWLNKSTPCQFLDLKTNMCGIYEVRPADCAGFPHLGKRKMVDYIHVHKQNIELCPATFRMVERMEEIVARGQERVASS